MPDIREIFDAALSAAFDAPPIRFRRSDERGVRPVQKACALDSAVPVQLRRALTRNAFLLGCLDLTQDELTEHLIVGFGTRHGSTTLVDCVAHVTGASASVSPAQWLSDAIARHPAQAHRSEVLIVHNHPRNVLNVALDNEPLASGTDRTTLARTYLDPVLLLKLATGGGLVRFYLVENRYVREFCTPRLLPLVEELQRVAGSHP